MESIAVRRSRAEGRGPTCPHWRPVLGLSALLGLSPLVFEGGKSKFSWRLAVYSILFSLGVAFIGFMEFHMQFYNLSVSIILRMNVIIYIGLHISSLIDVYSNAPIYSRILENLKVIDEKLSTLGVMKTQHRSWPELFLITIMLLSLFIVGLVLHFNVFQVFRFTLISSYSLTSAQIITVGSHILSRYELLLRTLSQLKDTQSIHNDVETLLSVNHKLSRSVNIFSSCYRLRLLALTTFTFCFVSSRLYMVYFFHKNMPFHLLFIYLTFFVCFQFSRIIFYSSSIMNKSRQFDLLLFQLMIGDEELGLLDNPKLNVHVAMKKNTIVSACGFFTLDFQLITTMAASVSTYLVMLVQFGSNLPNN